MKRVPEERHASLMAIACARHASDTPRVTLAIHTRPPPPPTASRPQVCAATCVAETHVCNNAPPPAERWSARRLRTAARMQDPGLPRGH
eukprot:scaffold21115_cov36-Phaeocystis_antarctica.AAC.1